MVNSTKLWEEKAKDFLPEHTIENLQNMLKKEKKKIAKKRQKACILRKEGKTLTQISLKLHIAKTTIYNWLNNISKFGLNRIYNIKNSGKSKLLSKEKFEELKSDNRIWFGKDLNGVPRIKRFLSEIKKYLI